MAQIFSRRSNTVARCGIVGAVILACFSGWVLHAVYWSPYTTLQEVPIDQTVPFSHQHHVAGLGLDCRFCHTTVEKSAFAGLPSTQTCMTCHSQLYTDAPLLAPVRASLASDKPLHWNRANYVPDFVFFNHSIHVNKGIGCSTCHGRMDEMPLTWKSRTLYMRWCLECHNDPAQHIRPREDVFQQEWPASTPRHIGEELVKAYHINTVQLADCSMCHR